MKSREVRCARVYDRAQPGDGTRVLVDRLWPRGIKKNDLELDAWVKEAAPSNELRHWYGHDPDKQPEFRERYLDELARPEGRAALDRLRELAGDGTLTLLTSTKDVNRSHLPVLATILRVPETDEGGEAACLLPRVCPECGRLADEDPPTRCQRCGTRIPSV